jgi:hypothetical protein
MFAVIRVNFPDSPAGARWSDAVTQAFLDPGIPYSMAHFWKRTTFDQVDMSYTLSPPITITDPRPNLPGPQQRDGLMKAVLDEFHRTQDPNWDAIDWCMIVFTTSGTELAGGGATATPGGTTIPLTMFNADSRFDAAADEVGHSLGLAHEMDATGTVEYGCRWSVMSAMSDATFVRPVDARLPGTPNPSDPNRTCGPLVPMAHLYINEHRAVNPSAALNSADSVTYVPVDYANAPQRVRLVARDAALAAWPVRRTVLAVVPPVTPGGDTYFLELRRTDAEYEQSIGNAKIVVLAGNFFSGSTAVTDTSKIRLKYMGALDLTKPSGDLDFRAPNGSFTATIGSVAADFETVDISISAGVGPGANGVRLGEPQETRSRLATSEWTTVEVSPCRSYPRREYAFRATTFEATQSFTALSLGYEGPTYTWYVNDAQCSPGVVTVPINASCRRFVQGEVSSAETRPVSCRCAVSGNTLQVTVSEPLYDIDLTVRVVVSETGLPAAGGGPPERTAVASAQCSTVDVEWDEAYRTDRANCLREAVERETGDTITVGARPGGLSGLAIRQGMLHLLGVGIPRPFELQIEQLDPGNLIQPQGSTTRRAGAR